MKMNLYSIKDTLLEFNGPVAIQNEEVALRIFEGFCKRKKTEELTEARYYDMYQIGEFDTETGKITAYEIPEIKLIREGRSYDV